MAQDPLRYFRIEVRELLEQMLVAVLALEKGPDADALGRMLRLAHTLKGAARVVKQREIADNAHAIEDVLAPHRQEPDGVSRSHVESVLTHVDAIKRLAVALGGGEAKEKPDQSPRAAQVEQHTIRTEVTEVDDLIDGITETQAHLGSLHRTFEDAEKIRRLAELLVESLARRARAEGDGGAHALAEELKRAYLSLERGMSNGLELAEREMRQVRDSAERLRLVPAAALFAPLERTARDVAQALDKRVEIICSGGEVRIDAHVLSTLQGALIQIIRNAVAHGIEPRAEREEQNKPPDGLVRINVSLASRHVVFRCTDDGKGFDVGALRRLAHAKGIEDVERLDAGHLVGRLLGAGLSTSGTVTEISGRGIGLDVVKEAVDRLGAKISVTTETGRGSTIELSAPVSLSSFDALLVEASGVTAGIPLDTVLVTMRLADHEVVHTADGDHILHDARMIPFAPLASLVNRPTDRNRAWSLVLLRTAAGPVAIGVDRLSGTSHAVLRALPDSAPADPMIAGVFLDAAGNPQLVLDPNGLLEATRRSIDQPRDVERAIAVLIIDDSLTTRMLEQSILESAGYEVDVASSGEEGLEKAKSKPYGLCLVDVEMPGMDGFEFIERIRADASLRSTPCILVTSRSSADDLQRGSAVGADDYVVKSEFNQVRLLDRIQELTR